MRAELLVIVHPRTGMRGQPAHHPAKLRIGAADPGFGRSIEVGFELGPFVIAAEGQRESAEHAVFTAQRKPLRCAIAGEGFVPRAVAVDALGVRTAVGRTQGQIIAVIGQAHIAPVAGGLLRILGIGEHEGRGGETVDLDFALCEIAMREQLEAGGQIDEGGGAERELLRSVCFGARGSRREPVGLVPRTGEPEEHRVIARPRRGAGKQRIARTEFDAAAHPALGPGRYVDYAANGFGAPDRAVRAAQHVDLARGTQQQIAEIEAACRTRLVGNAYAVDQHQQLVRTRAAQIDAGDAADTAAARQRKAGNAVQRTRRIGTLHRLDFSALDHGHRLAGVAQVGAQPVRSHRDDRRGARRDRRGGCRNRSIGRFGVLSLDDFRQRLLARALRERSRGNCRSRQEKQIFVHVTSYHERNAVHDGREQDRSIRVCHRYTPPAAERRSWAGLLAPGSSLSRRLPGHEAQWHEAGSLPGHSCGGSGGFAPPSLFGPAQTGQPVTRGGA